MTTKPDDDSKAIVGRYFSFIEEGERMPLSFRLKDGTFRLATEPELAEHLKRRPWDCENVAPAVLRRILPLHDGEFFALLSERRALRGEDGDLKANFEAICETPVVTDAAVAMKLRLLMDATWVGEIPLVRQRQLLLNAIEWLQEPFSGRSKGELTARPFDVETVRAYLKKFAVEEGAACAPDPVPALVAERMKIWAIAELPDKHSDEELKKLGDQYGALDNRIADMVAPSLDGILAQVELLIAMTEDEGAPEVWGDNRDRRLIGSIKTGLRNLLADARGAA